MEYVTGRFPAKITAYGIGSTKSGDPQIEIAFRFFDGNQHQALTWFGSLKEGKAQEITMKALVTCGFKGQDVEAIADGVPGGALDTEKEVEIDLGIHEYQGKKSVRINWINPLGGAGFRSLMKKDEARSKLASLNVKGTLAAVRAEMPQYQKTGTDEEAPF